MMHDVKNDKQTLYHPKCFTFAVHFLSSPVYRGDILHAIHQGPEECIQFTQRDDDKIHFTSLDAAVKYLRSLFPCHFFFFLKETPTEA